MRPLLFKSLISKPTVPLIGCVLAFAAVLPVAAKDKNQKKDPDAIGDRNVTCKVNWYSLEKEIALGKQLAQEVERQSQGYQRPGCRRIRQSRWPESGTQLRCESAVHDQGYRRRRSKCLCPPRRVLLRELGIDFKGRHRIGTGRRDGA